MRCVALGEAAWPFPHAGDAACRPVRLAFNGMQTIFRKGMFAIANTAAVLTALYIALASIWRDAALAQLP